MASSIRPTGSGRDATAHAFLRTTVAPAAAMVLVSEVAMPTDWPSADTGAEATIGHALGWTLEVRRRELVLVNPLGEGLIKCDLPELSAGWLQHVRADGSCAVFLARAGGPSATPAELVEHMRSDPDARAGTVRSAVADDYAKPDPVGRNAPCPCGSGKKHKHCCG